MTLGRVALLLPVATQLIVWALVSLHRARLGLRRLSARGTLVMAFVLVQVVLVAITELASVGHHLTAGTVEGAWLLVTVIAAAALVRTGGLDAARRWQHEGGWGRTGRAVWSRPVVAVGIVVLVLIGATLVYTAWIYLPNNSDSLAYHLTRVVHWIQERSVASFATHYLGQIQLAPLHEYDMLHLHLLAGTDRLDGFPQLASFVICVVGAAEVVRLLRGSAEVQVLAAVIAASTPALVLEATSTQNNLFPGAMAMGAVLLILAWEPLQPPVVPAVLFGFGVGLTALGKGTAIPMVAPVVVALGLRVVVAEVKASSWTTMLRRMLVVGAVGGLAVVVVVAPFQLRNREVLGSANGSVDGALNDEITPRAAAANSLRNLALQFHVGDDTSGLRTETSRLILPALGRAYDWTGVPINSGHLDYGFGQDAFEVRDYHEFERNEDYGASPWFTLLLVVCIPILCARAIRGDAAARTTALLAVGGVAGFVVFSVTTKWTPYGARYLLPLVALGPPLLALALAGVHRYLLRAVAIVLVIAGLPTLIDSWARPLIDRPVAANDLDPYVVARPVGDPALAKSTDFVSVRDAIKASGCTQVGVGNWVLFEYLLWVGLDHVDWQGTIEHIGPFRNDSRVLEDEDFRPCAIVRDAWLGLPSPAPEGMVPKVYGSLTLWLPPELAARAGITPDDPSMPVAS